MTDDPLRIWADAPFAVAEVVEKALAYEEAWTAHFRGAGLPNQDELLVARTRAAQALLEAVRALKERYG